MSQQLPIVSLQIQCLDMKKAFRKSLKRQASLNYLSSSLRNYSRSHSDAFKGLNGTPILWQALARKYQFNYPKDWYFVEAHWLDQIESFQEQPIDCPGRDAKMNNAITRISQCNESYQLCNSLPRSFIVPKDLKDVTLINSMSTIIKDHRVPIISYCCPIEYRRNFIIRCASSDQQSKVIEIMAQIVKPLKVLNLSAIAPTIDSVESAHKKLRDVCRPGEDTLNFISKSGKWLNIVSLALKIVKETARIVLNEASVMLIERDDKGWNNLVSSLVQMILEPHRRTIDGLESLISKEWIYLSGGQIDSSKPEPLFALFLDCIYQIYIQNPTKFEFTSEYLRYLFEAQYICIPFISNNDNRSNNNYSSQRTNGVLSKNKTSASFNHDETSEDIIGNEPASYTYYKQSINMMDLSISNNNNTVHDGKDANIDGKMQQDPVQQLDSGYHFLMFSPFYNPDYDLPPIEIHDHIANIKLWSSLYLRWQPVINYGCIEEIFYFQTQFPSLSKSSSQSKVT